MSARTQTHARERVQAFVAVGAVGFLLQIGILQLLVSVWNWPYLAATAIAVEAAVLNNFVWHERWTWSDRDRSGRGRWRRLMRFHISNGLTSIFGNVLVTAAGVELLRLPTAVANALAVTAVSVVNYLAADRWVFAAAPAEMRPTPSPGDEAEASMPGTDPQRRLGLGPVSLTASIVWLAGGLMLVAPARVSAQPRADTLAAWSRYVSHAESAWRPLASTPVEAAEPVGETIRVNGGTINRWTGSTILRDTTVDTLLSALQNPGLPPPAEDILDARVLHRASDSVRVYMKLARTALITVTYDTEHDVTFARLGRGLATSRSIATSIREEGGGDRGFLWRLNSYWTYRQVGRDVRVELLSLSLSRNVPALARPIASPIVTRIARESTVRALEALRRFGEGVS